MKILLDFGFLLKIILISVLISVLIGFGLGVYVMVRAEASGAEHHASALVSGRFA